MERDSRIALEFGISISSWIQSGGDVLFLYWLLPILNSVGFWLLVNVRIDGPRGGELGLFQNSKIDKTTLTYAMLVRLNSPTG